LLESGTGRSNFVRRACEMRCLSCRNAAPADRTTGHGPSQVENAVRLPGTNCHRFRRPKPVYIHSAMVARIARCKSVMFGRDVRWRSNRRSCARCKDLWSECTHSRFPLRCADRSAIVQTCDFDSGESVPNSFKLVAHHGRFRGIGSIRQPRNRRATMCSDARLRR